MGIAALGPKPRTAKPPPAHKVIPVSVARPDHRSGEPGVGGNITHISIGPGFFYLVAIIEQRVRSSPWLASDAIVCRKRNRFFALFSALFDGIAPNEHELITGLKSLGQQR
jgi:hypothetical protein